MFLSVDEPPLQGSRPSGDQKLEHLEGSPPGSSAAQPACLDVNVVPEHEEEQLQASISCLQGTPSPLTSVPI